MLGFLKRWMHSPKHAPKQEPTNAVDYKTMEIDVVIKCFVSDKDKPFRVIFKVEKQGSFFTRDIFVQNVDAKTPYELVYNFSALGMNYEELKRFGSTDYAEYSFATLEEAKKVKDTTVDYIRFLIREHQQETLAKIS
ncbi:hypothetical protein ACFPES_22105 [Paenibacillus sp. GCM10023248]|uniref:hypothetical protein n=1 Tax=unclassified Paenibacillus TaxID=185978 RepID=UPI00237984FB|nr:hypothetical protein [Paenibacillus sp. MAHUQ-63]MDD9269750.1 hypothetical protein [Paenibacillus sp. MAHUQ-63]